MICRRTSAYPLAIVATMISAGLSSAQQTGSKPAPAGRENEPTQRVTFVTADNIVLAGGYTAPPAGAKAPIAVLLHMYKQNRASYAPLAPVLHQAGFAVLAIDLRGHGESVGPAELQLAGRVEKRDAKLFAQMYHDVEAAYQWLAARPEVDPSRFVLVGASVGCSVALDYAARDRSVDAVVCMTPGTKYMDLDSLKHAAKFGRRPLLLLASEDERAAADELAKVVPQAKLHIVPGRGGERMTLHGTHMFGKVKGIETLIADFLTASSGPPATQPVVAALNGEVYHPADSSVVKRIKESNRRWFSSPQEAEARGLRPPKSK